MDREVDGLTEQQITRKRTRDTMLAVLERVSQLNAGGARQALPDAGTIPTSDQIGFRPDDDTPAMPGENDLREPNTDNRTGRHAWGGHANGRIPVDELIAIGNGQYLERGAAAAFEQMKRAAAEQGVTLSLSSAYRDYDAQVDIRKRLGDKVATATPGTSVHGWGRALDVSGGTAQAWLRANGHRFGFVWPKWAQQTGTKSFEPWHWEYTG